MSTSRNPTTKFRPNSSSSPNPFDSDSDDDSPSSYHSTKPKRSYPPRNSSNPSLPTSNSSNPFDDDDQGGYSFTPEKKGMGASRTPNPPKKSSDLRRNPFDDEFEEYNPEMGSTSSNADGGGAYKVRGRNMVSQVKEKAVTVGESAVRTAEKLKEVGVVQSNRLKPKKNDFVEDQKKRDELLSVDDPFPSSTSSSAYSTGVGGGGGRRNYHHKMDAASMQTQTVEELEDYAMYKSEETTKTTNNCLRIAEDIRENATDTLITLHKQGQQIEKTHLVATDIDRDLTRGEKLLGSLGGMFSKNWKPKKTPQLKGPLITRDDSFIRRTTHLEARERFGLSEHKERSDHRKYDTTDMTAQEKIEVEKTKQDDALSDLSNILNDLKVMAVDMGSEIERQTKALDNFSDDAEILGDRVKDANYRGRRLLKR